MRVIEQLGPAAIVLALLAGCGGGSGDGDLGSGGTGLREARAGDLVAYARTRISQGSHQGLMPAAAGTAATPAAAQGPGALDGQAPQQEAGVSEDDLLKTDGQHLYALHPRQSWASPVRPARLTMHRMAAGGSIEEVAAIDLDPAFHAPGMHVAQEIGRVAVIGAVEGFGDGAPADALPLMTTVLPWRGRTLVDVVATTDRPVPAIVQRMDIDGTPVTTRLVGNVLYIAATWRPDLGRYVAPAGSTPAQVDAALAGLTTQELLPTVRINGGPAQPLVAEQDCLLQPGNASRSFQLTLITAIDLGSSQLRRASRCFVGGTNAFYMTLDSLYLASSQSYNEDVFIAVSSPRFPAAVQTSIHKFSLDGLAIGYRGSGDVEGHLGWDREKTALRLSDHAGHLRVLSYTGQTGWFGPADAPQQQASPSPATLTVLRENPHARSLEVVATLPNARRPQALGKPGEQVYGVRFSGARAYVVTFRQTDPLYVLDLAIPADPQVAGELTIPGFSDYLFPLPDGKLLGVGKDATGEGLVQGLKLGLFDVADAARPRMVASVSLGARGSESALDYSRHGISLLAQGSQVRVALPVRLYEGTAGTQQAQAAVQGLARFEIDTAGGTLQQQVLVEAARFDGMADDALRQARYNLAHERSLLRPGATYYLSGGELRHIAQP